MGFVNNVTVGDQIFSLHQPVKITGRIEESKKVVFVPDEMLDIINDGHVYKIDHIKTERDRVLVHAASWWWSVKNIEAVKPLEKPKPETFDINQLVI